MGKKILNVWVDEGWGEPAIEEGVDADRTILSLEHQKASDKNKQ